MYSPSFTRAVAIEAVLRRTVDDFGARRHLTMIETGNGDTVPVSLLSSELFRLLILLLMPNLKVVVLFVEKAGSSSL